MATIGETTWKKKNQWIFKKSTDKIVTKCKETLFPTY